MEVEGDAGPMAGDGPGAPTDAPLLIGDPDWLQRALLNVLDNAVRYSPPGGRVAVACTLRDARCRITVTNDGPGVPAAVLPQLGTRFFRPQAARDRPSGGTGLGLAITREIVERHGGRLTFDSPPGKGLEVGVELPAPPSPSDL